MSMFQRLPIDLKYNVEIMEKERQSESCNDVITLSDDVIALSDDVIALSDDVIALSDDDGYIEDDNYEINIKVYWRSNRIDRLSMRRVCISVMCELVIYGKL